MMELASWIYDVSQDIARLQRLEQAICANLKYICCSEGPTKEYEVLRENINAELQEIHPDYDLLAGYLQEMLGIVEFFIEDRRKFDEYSKRRK